MAHLRMKPRLLARLLSLNHNDIPLFLVLWEDHLIPCLFLRPLVLSYVQLYTYV